MAAASSNYRPAPPRIRPANGLLLSDRAVLILVRRLLGPFALFLVFVLFCVLAYMRLEHLRFADALFWVAHAHAIEYLQVRTATKYFSLVVAIGIFAFEIWFAERILLALSDIKAGRYGNP